MEMQRFIRVQSIFALLFAFASFVSLFAIGSQEVESKRVQPITFGTERTVNIYPAAVETVDWAGVDSVLVQDLRDDSLYQDFSARNSAYVPRPVLILPSDESQPADVQTEAVPTTDEQLPIETVIESEPVVEPPIIIEEQSETLPSPIIDETTSFNWGVFETDVRLYPLAQLTLTASTEVTSSPAVELTNVVELLQADVTEPEVPITASTSELVPPETVQSDVALEATSTTETASTSLLLPSKEVHEITLSNFDTAPLEPGQFVNGMQLRMSFAAQLITKVPEGRPAPYIEVLFGVDSVYSSVGTIILDDEVSNALNGGYFLFALPQNVEIDALASSSVIIRYHGTVENLDGMFLDTVWLELDTRIVTKDDLLARGKDHTFNQLETPEFSTLVSEQLNFARTELPTFNLRYNSQRNPLVRGMRNLIGRDLVAVEEIRLRHVSQGYIGVTPIITTTKEGLLTIEIEDTDKDIMPPGEYAVEIIYNEGGKRVEDTFDFQWGIITINPNKSEYETGEIADISIGALTPNGHTICQANLDLYVIDPIGNITRPVVTESGLCDGNNVIDVPDFSAVVPTMMPGTYELYLERLDDAGTVLGYTTDTFLVRDAQMLSIERVGPTRIYPRAPYTMELTAQSEQTFQGTLTERVPSNFVISQTNAAIEMVGDWQLLTWDFNVLGGGTKTVSYTFDAPDISPYLFNLGPASLQDDSEKQIITGSTTASSTVVETQTSFTEHRQWQIASDAVGNMLLFWANGASVPTDWICVSCAGGDPFFQRFIMGSSTYNSTGGAATHTHTAVGSVYTTAETGGETGTGSVAPLTHTHTYTPTIGSASNLPSYRQLRVIRYNAAAGEPPTIPAGAIAIFDVASSSLPANWNRYAAQDGRYVYAENTPGTTGGSNTHTHAISGTTGAASGAGTRSRGGTANGSSNTHTHTVSGATPSLSNEPPYIEVLLAQASTDVVPTNGIIAMWTEDVDGGWLDVSSSPGDAFASKFIKATTTYGSTGGASSHTHANVTGLTTSAPSATQNSVDGPAGASDTHTHQVDVTTFSTTSHLPPYVTAVFGKRQGTDPVFEQTSSRWYVNLLNQTPTDEWPNDSVQALDLAEREPITATSTPVKVDDEVRLRINAQVTNATSTAGSSFKLQYASTASVCSAATGWADVGNAASSTIWRGYDNTGVSDGVTLSAQLLASTTVSETYEEDGVAASTPNDISVDDYAEWDFVLQHNGADAGTNYCFRMVEGDGTVFYSYSHYPQLYTNEAPEASTLFKLFDNEKTPSTTPWFQFSSVDAEGDKVHYQIQVDNNYDFSSTVLDRNTISNSAEFENQVLISDKAPFREGELIQFIPSTTLTNGTTYYWRVRAQDPDASQEWGGWSEIRSFTVDTSLTATAWYQTEDEQFDTNTKTGVQTGSDQVVLISGSTTGTMVSTAIDFSDGTQGTAWDSLVFNDTETTGDLKYQIQYYDGSAWALIPDGDLSGNSTGFDASAISLLGLDVDVYGIIRLVANFTNSGGSPSLQDWTINWGYRVETPTITKLFANEQTGTTTPTLEFSTSDPQGDDLTYEVSWSTTPDFTSSTTRNSTANPTGFSNILFGGDTDPFNSGDTIQYTIQSADALTGTTTYWWRVRAKDTTGDNAWSFWTDAQSFTVIPGTDVSTWLQTTEEQFDTNILSGTVSLTTDVVTVATTASEAMVVYGEGTNSTPRYRQWDGSSWGSEGTLQDVGATIRWAVVKAGTTREEFIAGTIGTDADLNVQVFSNGAWGNLFELTPNVGNISARGFDIAYESLSGDALVVFCDGDADPSYYTWDGSSWSGPGTVNLASTNNCEWVKLSADPVSNEIVIMSRDSVGTGAASYEAQVWSGTAIVGGSSATQGGARGAAYETMALNYEESGGQAIIVSGDSTPVRFEYNSWGGATWVGAANNSTISDNLMWAQLVRDSGTDAMSLCYVDESSNIGVIRWDGGAWTGQTDLDVGGAKTQADRPVSCVYETTSGRDGYVMTMYSDATNARYRAFNGATWSAEASISTITDSSVVQSIRTGVGTILALFFDDTNDRLDFSSWNGSTWSTAETLETDMSVNSSPFGEPFSITPRRNGTAGTTIVSPGIDFDDGNGPYWQSFSWNDTTPGTSEILYHLQYLTSTGSWAFIPDTALPGNVAGTTTGPFDLSGLNTNTYNVIRPYAELTCQNASTCPSITDWKVEWAGGITISGTAQQYDQSTNVTSGTVAVAVNGVLQTGKTGTISGGVWSIDNVTTFAGDVVTLFVTGAGNTNEAVAVARYDGQGDMDGISLFERHLTLGSNDATTTPFTNADIGLYDFTNTEDIFANVTGTVLNVCADTGCADAELYIKPGAYYSPGGTVMTHDLENNGTFTAGSNIIELSGSWDNNATTTMTGSTVRFSATSTTESIDSTGAITASFNNVVFGTTTGSGVWSLSSTLDVNGSLTVSRGTLARGNTAITVAGNLTNGTSGTWTGRGTTTFDGTTAATWADQNATLQNIGRVVIDGTSKIVSLTGNVAAQSITIGANDTLDASATGYDITVYDYWLNQNNFIPRTGEVFFVATTSAAITTAGDAFYDLTFNSGAGSWSFTENALLVSNDFTVAAGSVTLPNGTTTIAGSFDATGGTFAHNNGTLYFTSSAAETLTFDGGLFTNVAHILSFNGGGSWTVTDTHATATDDVRVAQGTLTFPNGVFAIGGSLTDSGGAFVGGTGEVTFYSAGSESIRMGGSSFNSVSFNGAGSWSFTDATADANADVTVYQGSVTLPSSTFTIGGSYTNSSTVIPNNGTVVFDSADTGETVDFGGDALYNVTFNGAGGGWTLVSSATTTNNFILSAGTNWTLASGQALSIGGQFTNSIGGAATTWTGSTLSLESGAYSINTKATTGDSYETLRVAASAAIAMWNSSAASYTINGSLYSQDHAAVDGDLYIFGAYTRTGGNEYWSYATDFDGTALGGGSRQVDVRFASGASATLNDVIFNLGNQSTATTTIANQGSGTYTVTVNGGTTTARYYQFSDLGSTGVSFNDAAIVSVLRDGAYTVAAPGGSALTLSSTTIDANPGKQIYNVAFATSTAISANNVSQTDGTPTSYWWFREGTGNLYGEAFDNDTGDPGSVRFDDSSLVISISGTVYSDAGITPIVGGTCNGSAPVVRVMVDGVESASTSCSAVDGSFTASGIVVVGDPTITVYLNDAIGGERGSVITRTPTADITDLDIYANRVIVRNEDTAPLTIENLALFDADNDSDIRFVAATTTTPDTLTTFAGTELFVFASSTFAPGGDVTLSGNAQSNGYDGTLYIGNNATFTGSDSSVYTLGGRLVVTTGATWDAASSSVVMNATTSGKSISASSTLTFQNLSFTGAAGDWNLSTPLIVDGNMQVNAGIVTGNQNITLTAGSLTGNGTLSLGGGTTLLSVSNSLGGTSPWTFYNLQLGNGVVVGTTTPLFTSTTTISGTLTIANAHFLDAGNTSWDLAGTGSVFVETGTFLEDTSRIRYSGNGSSVLSTQYYNLDINAGAGTPTYTATGLGIIVTNDLTVGGSAPTVFEINTNDPAFDVNGDVEIRSNGTLSLSNSAAFSIAGNYDNNGTLTPNGGTLTFDGAGTSNIAAGNSSFANVTINATGAVTVTEHATATTNWILTNAGAFTVNSGQVLAVGGQFTNALSGAATTWTGATLRLYGGGDYSINTTATSDTYNTLVVADTTQIRMWNSAATTYTVANTASLYSQDHAAVDGDLYIWGAYRKTSATDFWSYNYDFNGTPLGSPRKVDVFFAPDASVTITGGVLAVYGNGAASTTLQTQGGGDYSVVIGGTASSALRYYEVRDIDANGLTFTGSAKVNGFSNGDLEVSVNGGTAVTVGGTVINNNPAKNFNLNRFALNGVGSGFNVTATGTSVSSWRFVNHFGDIDGESFDVDPGGDPGYIAWDDSAALITIAGIVYQDDTTTVSTACASGVVRLVVAGLTSATTTCNVGTGAYSFSNVSYGPNDSLIVYIDGATEKGAAVTRSPISNISNLDIYENHVIVRHENTDPITIADMAVWDSSDDGDIPFTAVDAGTDTLTLPADRKLLVWTGKEFEPTGNVTLTNGGSETYGGSLQLFDNAIWTGQGTESLSVGGSMNLNAGATFTTSNGTTTFTTSGSGRTINVNEDSFYTLAFTGSGSWTVSDTNLNTTHYVQTAGAVTLPTGSTTVSGSFIKNGGTFDANNGELVLNGSGTRSIKTNGSNLAALTVEQGTYSFLDTNATATESVVINGGTLTLPSGLFVIGGDFLNEAGTITHNTSELVFTNATAAQVQASSSDLYTLTFTGGGAYTINDTDITLLDSLSIDSGSLVLASTTTSIGGSFDASGGTFTAGSSTVLFNSSDGGEIINPGSSTFYNVQIGAPTGGYSITASATTTNNFTLATANSFTLQSGATLKVEGVFTNTVGGGATTWTGSTLALDGANAYTINTKASGGDQYATLWIGANSDIRAWNSAATAVTIDPSASFYSQDNAAVDGALYIYGDFRIATTTEYWSYATDFDGTSIVGSPRAVTVSHATSATTTVVSGTLNMVGASGNNTTITNQGSGTYAMSVTGGTLNAQYYAYRNLNSTGLSLSGTPTITSLSYGDFELAVDTGTLITLAAATLNANASLIITGNRFATTTAIGGYNVTLVGTTPSVWTFVGHTGNLDGENFDVDGGDDCSSVRWDDSSCLVTQQTHYRWRNDDAGLGVPSSEWFNADWDARQRVRIINTNTSPTTDAVVRFEVVYDADMQADFDDLRFTDSTGLSTLNYWIGSTTDSVMAEVWVQIPTLAAEDTTTIFMYYNNPTANSSSSVTDTFIAGDDFEDDNISEYSGQTTLFNTDITYAFDGTYGLDNNNGNTESRANLGGIYRLDQTISQNETIRFMQYVDPAATLDEVCTKFAIQNTSVPNNNYAVCVEFPGTDRVSLVRNVVENESSGTLLSSKSTTFSEGWYAFEVDWSDTAGGTLDLSVYDAAGTLVATTSATDSNYSSGGYGFTFWYNHGGWDSFSSRPLIDTEPTVLFGAEQTEGGGSWKAAQDTAATYNVTDIARLRVVVENTGLAITNQQFLLEYAPQDTAPSCEAVDPADYVPVPIQSSCGTSPVCMQSSSFVTNGANTVDLLSVDENTFVPGEAREDPSNITGNLDVDQYEYTELEYVLTPTINVVDQNLCFRVTDNGTDYDTYLRVAKLQLRFDPVLSTPFLNEGLDISLVPGTTTRVYASTTVTDLNGYTDIVTATTTFFRSGVGAACSADNNSCYISTTNNARCSFTDCAGDSCTLECYADIYFHADPTATSSAFEGQEWLAFLEVEDAQGGYDFDTTPGVEMNILRAIDVDDVITYTAIEANSDTGADNASTTIENLGNVEVDIEVQGTDLSDGISSIIPANEQKFATSTFTYSACASCQLVSSTSAVSLDVDLTKPTADTPPVADEIYWGIAVPFGVSSSAHQGYNVFTPISP